jgi:transposase-like protein
MPRPHPQRRAHRRGTVGPGLASPPEFRRQAVELANEHAKPVSVIASDLGISESCFRRWMAQVTSPAAGGRAPRATSEPSWSRRVRRSAPSFANSCAGSFGSRRWRTRTCVASRPISPGRTSSQNEVRLHRPSL